MIANERATLLTSLRRPGCGVSLPAIGIAARERGNSHPARFYTPSNSRIAPAAISNARSRSACSYRSHVKINSSACLSRTNNLERIDFR